VCVCVCICVYVSACASVFYVCVSACVYIYMEFPHFTYFKHKSMCLCVSWKTKHKNNILMCLWVYVYLYWACWTVNAVLILLEQNQILLNILQQNNSYVPCFAWRLSINELSSDSRSSALFSAPLRSSHRFLSRLSLPSLHKWVCTCENTSTK